MECPRRLPLLVTGACCSPAAWGLATEATAHTEIRDIRGPIAVDSLPPFALSGGMLLLIAGLFIARHRLRRRVPMRTPPAADQPDARARLAMLADRYRQGRCTGVDLIIRLDALVREILASNTGVTARHLTSTELRHRAGLTGMLSESRQVQFDGFLALCDRVKFACHRPASSEIDAAMRAAAGLFDTIAAGQAA